MLDSPSILFCFSSVASQGDWNPSTWNIYIYINLKLYRCIFHGIPKLAIYSLACSKSLRCAPLPWPDSAEQKHFLFRVHLFVVFLPLQLLPTKPTEDAENMSPPTSGNKNHLTPFLSIKTQMMENTLDRFLKMSDVLRRHCLSSLSIYTTCERVLFCTWFRVGMCLTE